MAEDHVRVVTAWESAQLMRHGATVAKAQIEVVDSADAKEMLEALIGLMLQLGYMPTSIASACGDYAQENGGSGG